MKKIAVVGFGLRAETVVKNLAQYNMQACVSCICDLDVAHVKQRLESIHINSSTITFYDDIDTMMNIEEVHGIMIATNCKSHTDLAIKAMTYKLPIFLAKPVAISEDQLALLDEANTLYHPNVLVSFPLRATPLCQKAKEIIDSGVLGTLSQVQSINNVAYARVYYHAWYHDQENTGGLFLQKSTHDIDLIQYLISDIPTTVCAMESRSIFGGNKPVGLTCPDCSEYFTCPESSHTVANTYLEPVDGDYCAFAADTTNHDSASILMQFANGANAMYAQNFIVRKDAAKRQTRIIGYKATLEFDFVTGVIHVYHHDSNITETITVNTDGLNHFGGDKKLAENFVAMMYGTEESLAPLSSGIESARTCLKAKKSAATKLFQ